MIHNTFSNIYIHPYASLSFSFFVKKATWVDNTVCTSVVMILLAMIGATSSWCLGSNGPSDLPFEDTEHVALVRKLFTNGCFYLIILLQLMLLVNI
jgi:hypothetical protein